MSKAKSWFTMAAGKSGNGEIRIFNDIGDFGVTAMDFANELDSIGKVSTLNISISSNGGDVAQGFAIYNMLNRHKARKVVTIEGLAASMASVIAMAGDEVLMPANAMMMIHNPWGITMGEADQMKSFGEALETMQDNIADAYVARTGMDKTEVEAMMARETWLSAKKAVELGFADSVEEVLQIAAAFDLRKFNHVPKKFADSNERIAKMSKTKQNAADMTEESDDGDTTAKTPAQVRAEILAHSREVRSLCNLAGFPKLADGFIDKDLSLSEVIVALDAAKTKAADKGKGGKDKATDDEIDAHNNGRGDNHKPPAEINPAQIYANWNKSGKK